MRKSSSKKNKKTTKLAILMKSKMTRIITAAIIVALLVPLAVTAATSLAPVAGQAPIGPEADASRSTASAISGKIYINGKEASIRGYSVFGMEYVSIPDIGKALNIHAAIDEPSKAITIDTMRPYSGSNSAAQALAQTSTAAHSSYSITVNGMESAIDAYVVDNVGYPLLLSVALWLDIGIEYELNGNVRINTLAGFMGDKERNIALPRVELPAGHRAVDQPTEDLAYQRIAAMQSLYPGGWRQPYDPNASGWSAEFAAWMSNAAFGDSLIAAPERKHSDFDAIRVGDIVRINNDTHSVVVLMITESHITTVEGDVDSQVQWGRAYSVSEFRGIFDYALTRYTD